MYQKYVFCYAVLPTIFPGFVIVELAILILTYQAWQIWSKCFCVLLASNSVKFRENSFSQKLNFADISETSFLEKFLPLKLKSDGILHYLCSDDLSESFPQLILPIFTFSRYFFNRFCPVEKCMATPYC